MSGTPDSRPGAVVVGAGVAGLVAARDLARRGTPVTVLEAAERPGGCVAPLELAGLVLDAGAESFATRTSAVADLLTELGLGDRIVRPAASGAWVHLPSGSVPLPAEGVLGIPGNPWAPDVRRAVGRLGAARAAVDALLPPRIGLPKGPVALGDVVRARMGRLVLDRLVSPVVAGVYSTSAEASDLDTALPGLRALVKQEGSLAAAVRRLRSGPRAGPGLASLEGGMRRLVEALVEDLVSRGVTVRTATPVERIARSSAGGWRLRTTAGERVGASRVVLAVPPPVAVHLLDELVPQAEDLAGPTADVALVTLVVESTELDAAPRGTGVLVAPGVPGVAAKALTHATAKWAWLAQAAGQGRHVLRLSYGRVDDAVPRSGRPTRPALTDPRELPDAELRELARRDAATLLGVPLPHDAVVDAAVVRWHGVLPVVRPGHEERMKVVRAALAEQPGLTVCGSWLAGTGLAAVVGDARAAVAAAPG